MLRIPVLENLLHFSENIAARELHLLSFDSRHNRLPFGLIVGVLLLRENIRTVQESLHGTFTIEGTRVEEHLPAFERKQECTGQAHFRNPRRDLSHHDHHGILQLPVDLGGQFGREEFILREKHQRGVLMVKHGVGLGVQIVPVEVQRVENAKESDGVQREIVDG